MKIFKIKNLPIKNIRPKRKSMIENRFFGSYRELKRTENWKQIITNGKEVLIDKEIDVEDRIKIHIRIAESYFYLGEYTHAKENAYKAKHFIIKFKVGNNDLLAKSYYLLAISYKGLYENKFNIFGKEKLRKKALEWTEKSLELSNIPTNLKENTIGKIYYNASAVYQEVAQDYEKAKKYIYEAMKIFSKFDCMNINYKKAELRNIKLELDLGYKNYSVVGITNYRSGLGTQSRIKVHYMQIYSQVEYNQGNYEAAFKAASEAIEIATPKFLQQEIKRSKKLLKEIQYKKDNLKDDKNSFQYELEADRLNTLTFNGRISM